jgi:glycosyltransferase involved in cell wall biosynthesis
MRWDIFSAQEHVGYPFIDSVPKGAHRPYWSVMIPTYNSDKYLEKTLKSVLEQDLGPKEMQIEVVDDCSKKDAPERVVKGIGSGRVRFYRQPYNVGATQNFNTCIKRSIGQIVHILHSDDFVLPGFYKRMKTILRKFPNCGMVASRVLLVDARGIELGTSKALSDSSCILEQYHLRMNTEDPIRTPGVVVRRSTYERLGGYDVRLAHSADWEMWLRISANTPIWYEHDVLATYRVHPAADTSRFRISGSYIDEARKTIEIATRRLQIPNVREFRTVGLRVYAGVALEEGRSRAVSGDLLGAARMVWKGVRCTPTMRTFWRGFRIVARAAKRQYP